MKKTLHNSDVSGAKTNVPDLQVYGNGDLWYLLCKASSQSEGWMKSTKAMEIVHDYGNNIRTVVGCLVQVTTQQGDNIAEALTYIRNVKISRSSKGGGTLVPA